MPLPDADTGWRFCVAPMLDWTDRHCRGFHRSLSAHARLYTEMITTGALIHGDADRLLAFAPAEHPVALQLGGSEPDELARCARLAQTHGYDEINLNCGCPSERVQRGAFGACLMAEPALVRDCVAAMCLATCVTTPRNIRWRCSWAAASRAIWRTARGWVSSGVMTRLTSTVAAPASAYSAARLAPA
jgi:tRNA-dihydrouridine synthase A